MAIINFYSVPELDISYEHVAWFDGLAAQERWFFNKQKGSAEAKLAMDPTRISVTIGQPYRYFKQNNIDYCMIEDDMSRKKFYYFIINFEYKALNATTLILKLDVIQTYQTSLVFQDTFVDRMHVDRWKRNAENYLVPTDNHQEEGLQFGDLVVVDAERTRYRDKYIITSSTVLGKSSQSGSGNPSPPSPPPPKPQEDCWKSGGFTNGILRLIKGYEGYAPRQYKDPKGYWTIGYGTTQHGEPSTYNKLVGMNGASEQACTEAFVERLKNKYAPAVLKYANEFGITRQCEFDAMLSMAYNGGPDMFSASNSPNVKRYITGYKKGTISKSEFKKWMSEYYTGKPSDNTHAGLVARRTQETNYFCGDPYEVRPIGIINTSGKITGTHQGDGYMPSNTCQTGGGGSEPGEHYDYIFQGIKCEYPTHGRCTAAFPRYPKGGWHSGTDIGAPKGNHVVAPCAMEIVRMEVLSDKENDKNGSYGRFMVGKPLGTDYYLYFCHLSAYEPGIKVGSKVYKGQLIAKVGSTGNSTGPHLHFEARKPPYKYGDGKGNGTDCISPIPGLGFDDII